MMLYRRRRTRLGLIPGGTLFSQLNKGVKKDAVVVSTELVIRHVKNSDKSAKEGSGEVAGQRMKWPPTCHSCRVSVRLSFREGRLVFSVSLTKIDH